MLYEKPSMKTLDEIELSLRESAARHEFGVLHVHDLQAKMREKGIEMERCCSVFEICNPAQAKQMLDVKGSVSSALPCRIAVYQEGEALIVSTILPSAMLGMFRSPELARMAEEVEAVVKAMVDESA